LREYGNDPRAMLLYAAEGRWGARRKFQPRHFRMLTDAFAPERVRWTDSLADLPNGGWGLVIHAPGAFSLDRWLALRHSAGHFVFGALSREERRALDKRGGVLVLDLSWDPLSAQEDIVAGLIRSVERSGLDPERIRLVHSNQAARAPFETLWRRLSGREPLRTLEFPTSFALAVAHHHGRWSPERIEARLARARAALTSGERSRLFSSFNGGLRAQRLHMVAWMDHVGLLERGHVSMLAYRKGPLVLRRLRRGASRRPPANIRSSLEKLPFAEEIEASLLDVWSRLPLTLDLERDFRDDGYEHVVWESPDLRYYDDSWLSVVVESHADRTETLHITEKVAKPMLNAHPFLAVGSQSAMAQLAAYGFEGFAPEFREDFDGWPWPRERYRRVLKELRRLSSLTPADLQQLCIELWPRCEHNLRHLVGGGARQALSAAFETEVLDQLAG
jgi:hypothetical protein